jgi:hypothetical protein
MKQEDFKIASVTIFNEVKQIYSCNEWKDKGERRETELTKTKNQMEIHKLKLQYLGKIYG